MDSDRGRLLFVLDNDFGELTLAMCFLHRQAFAARSTLLLPPRLYALNSRSLGVRAIPYASYDELIGSLEAERADLVFLCSGYLLGLHGLIPRGSLGDLVSRVRRSGARVVTFDPFWGLMATPHELVREHFLQASRSGPLGRMLSMITRWSRPLRFMTEASGVLRSIPHLYPAPIVTSKVAAMSFFNRALSRPTRVTSRRPSPASAMNRGRTGCSS